MMPPSDFVGSENRELGQETTRPAVVSDCLLRTLERMKKWWLDRLRAARENRLSPWYQEEWKERCQSIDMGLKTIKAQGWSLQEELHWSRAERGVQPAEQSPAEETRKIEKNYMVVLEKLEGKQTHGQDKLILRHVTELNTDEKILSLNPLSFSRQKFSSFKPHS